MESDPPVARRRLSELGVKERRRVVLHASLKLAFAWAILITGYYLIPIGSEDRPHVFVRLAIDVGLIALFLAWQMRQISQAELPELRAIESLGILLVVLLLVFSAIYLSLSHSLPSTFTQQLDHTRALYFTVTVFSTVGFGDITPKTDPARLLVSAQMLVDLVLIGAVVRLLVNVAKVSLETRTQEPSQ